jgi:NADPH:quinone reductase-like Zn-dependent oxidoreductase
MGATMKALNVPAAALPLAGATAAASVDAVDAQPGQVVLVAGAGGGVGSYAVQLLAARRVTEVLPLDQAAEGLATIAAGQVHGKIVVKLSD